MKLEIKDSIKIPKRISKWSLRMLQMAPISLFASIDVLVLCFMWMEIVMPIRIFMNEYSDGL